MRAAAASARDLAAPGAIQAYSSTFTLVVTFSSDSRPIISRGPSLGTRFVLLALLSVAVMVLDHRQGHLDRVREWLSAATYPLQWAVDVPHRVADWLAASFAAHENLRSENERMQAQLRLANLRLQRFEALEAENRRLRAIRQSSAGIAEQTLVAEIMRVDLDPFRHRVVINKGTAHGVFKGQAILDASGIFGQITRAGRYTSEAILISDAEHAIPVQSNRTGLRTIAVGTGDLKRLSLPFLTVDADIKVDDLLVSSGLGGIFPAGYPVAVISRVERDAAATFAVVEAQPSAQLDRDREVLLVWFDQPEEHGTVAATPDSTGDSEGHEP